MQQAINTSYFSSKICTTGERQLWILLILDSWLCIYLLHFWGVASHQATTKTSHSARWSWAKSWLEHENMVLITWYFDNMVFSQTFWSFLSKWELLLPMCRLQIWKNNAAALKSWFYFNIDKSLAMRCLAELCWVQWCPAQSLDSPVLAVEVGCGLSLEEVLPSPTCTQWQQPLALPSASLTLNFMEGPSH